MNFALIGKIAGAFALTLSLAACVDMTQDIKVTSSTTADLTVTTTMSADIYPMIKAGAAGEDAEPFCEEEGSTLTENADGSATCVMTSSGAFDELKYDEDDSSSKPTFTTNPDGTVRVAVETNMDEVGDGYAEKKMPFLDLINGTIELPEELYAVLRP